MAVPPPAPSPDRQPGPPGTTGRPPARSPENPGPIDRALLAAQHHPVAPAAPPDAAPPPRRAPRPAPAPMPHPRPRPTPDGRAGAAPAGAGGAQAPAPGDRPGPVGRPGLRLRPVVHVEDMAASVAFYRGLGAEIVHGDPDGDWVLVQLGSIQLDLITRPPRAEHGECTVELNFAAEEPLARLRDRLRRSGDPDADIAVHPDLGEQLEVRTPDGLLIKISQLEPGL